VLVAVLTALTLTVTGLAALPGGGALPGGSVLGPRAAAAFADADGSAALAALHAAAAGRGPGSYGLTTLGASGWQVLSSAKVRQGGVKVSTAGFPTAGWLRVKPDDGGAPGTEIEALLQNGACPDVFYSDNRRRCFGTQATGRETVPQFAVPWWYRTTFTAPPAGQQSTLVVNGVVGQADLFVDGHQVATKAQVQGNYTQYRFDVTSLLTPGTNAVALKVYPNNPNTMFTLDNVDWTQVAPDQNTGIQFPVQLQTSAALALTDAHVNQQDATDLSTAALTVAARVTNNTRSSQTGSFSALIVGPDGGRPVFVTTTVTVPAAASSAVTLTPAEHPSLTVQHPQIWWPYEMGKQPMYTLVTALEQHGRLINTSTAQFGIRTVSSALVGPSRLAPGGVRQYSINGKPFIVRGGGFSENLFLHYSAADTANQIVLLKSMGLNTLRLEGHFMPDDFYRQMDRAGMLIASGYQCCDAWELPTDRPTTPQKLTVLGLSATTVAQLLRNHPSVFTFQWSDNNPTDAQEAVTLTAFRAEDLEVPIISSAEYNSSAQLGLSGEKEGPYDWVPPSYWYDTSHSDYADDSTLTNVGGSWGLDSEASAGHTVPTQDSMKRFLSPADQAALWQQPAANQYHANAETDTSGYSFGTLYNFDTALTKRYGSWNGLAKYTQEAQVQNYENVRSQFEAFIDHSTAVDSPSTGTIYWMANKGWPTLLWDLYNYDYDEAGSYFGAQEANVPVHALFATDDNTVTVDNLTGVVQRGLSVDAKVYSVEGTLLDHRSVFHIDLASQQVRNKVLAPKVPATTAPPTTAVVYFVELQVSRDGRLIDRNVYWESTQADVVDWDQTTGNPQATMTQYADLTDLQGLAPASVRTTSHTTRSGGTAQTTVTITNIAKTSTVAFFLRADVRRGNAAGRPLAGDNEVRPVAWSSNDVTLWPGQTQTLTATYPAAQLGRHAAVVSLYGWNLQNRVIVSN
jgi:exo-1,4-beta-D-glucosaminidase